MMKFHFKYVLILAISLFFCGTTISANENGFAYEVEFKGTDNQELLNLLESSSKLIILKNTPPKTYAALKLRVEDDIPNLLKALQSMAYYHAKIDPVIDNTTSPISITVNVTTGPVYPFSSFKIVHVEESPCDYPLTSILPADLGITIDTPALPGKIITAEEILISFLTREGYPLSKIAQREVIADQTTKSITVILHLNTGPLATFGETTISGNKNVLPQFFDRKIMWCEGSRYDPQAIARTLAGLEASGLFSSINITHDETALENGSLPMQILVKEAKHRSVAFGVGYATDLGPGINAEWEHRNIRGLGEKLRVVANIWQIKQEGYVRYIKPDFLCPRQDLIWQAEVVHEITKGFRESAFNFSGTIERQLTDHLRISYGGMFSRLRNSHSNNNRNFNLFKIPLQMMWIKTNSLLDPTSGLSMHFRTTPTLQTLAPRFGYCTHILTTTAYQPLDCNHRFVLAAKSTFGSIWGANDRRLPPSERFYAGSESLLRGYRYMTVSPLGLHHKPIGGRSLMVFSLETRMRVYDPFGVVVFYDVGNVYRSSIPQFQHEQLQSVGLGLRYHTPVGPLRVDIGFPLNRRKHLDRSFQLYFSIGQSF